MNVQVRSFFTDYRDMQGAEAKVVPSFACASRRLAYVD